MRIFKHLRSDWFRYGFETLAVIVGILAAFALENWREERQVKEEEHEILVNLLNDLHDAEKQSLSLISTEDEKRKLLLLALNQNSGSDTLFQSLNSDSIFYNIIWNVDMEVPIINSYADIKNTGRTGLISNEQIRQQFTNLEISIHNLRNQIDDRLRVQQLRIDEIAVTELNYVRMISYRNLEIRALDETENDYRALFADQRIRNLIAIKLNLFNGVIRYRKALDVEIKKLISLLEEEISSHHIAYARAVRCVKNEEFIQSFVSIQIRHLHDQNCDRC